MKSETAQIQCDRRGQHEEHEWVNSGGLRCRCLGVNPQHLFEQPGGAW